MRFISFFVLFAILFFGMLPNSYSHGYDVPRETTVYNNSGTALAIATSQINPDWATNKLQFGAGLGTYKDDSAIAVGIAKRAGKILINGSFGVESGNIGIGVGINTRF